MSGSYLVEQPTTEFVPVTIWAPSDPTLSGVPSFAFQPAGSDAALSWVNGSWVSGSWSASTGSAVALTPSLSDGTVTLSAGRYVVFVRHTLGSETPVMSVGVLAVR